MRLLKPKNLNKEIFFEPFSLSTTSFHWICENVWNFEQTKFFIENRRIQAQQIFLPPTYQRRPKSGKNFVAGRWILQILDGPEIKLVASVEAHAFFKCFKTIFVVVSLPPEYSLDLGKTLFAPMSLILSALFIVFRCDNLQLILTEDLKKEIQVLNWGSIREVFSFNKSDSFFLSNQDLSPFTMLTINTHEWWEYENAKKDAGTLSYLSKRVERKIREDEQCMPSKKTKRGVFSRLLWWWD